MLTQIKTFIVEDVIKVEDIINSWLSENRDIEVQMIYPVGIAAHKPDKVEATPCLMFILTYNKEGWK